MGSVGGFQQELDPEARAKFPGTVEYVNAQLREQEKKRNKFLSTVPGTAEHAAAQQRITDETRAKQDDDTGMFLAALSRAAVDRQLRSSQGRDRAFMTPRPRGLY